MKRFALVFCLFLGPIAAAQAQKPAHTLSETNLREPPKSTPNAGLPSDYLLISSAQIGGVHYLRFDVPVREIKVDDPDILEAEVSPNDETTAVIKPKSVGTTRVVIFGSPDSEYKFKNLSGATLLYDAQIAIGSRVVTTKSKGVREVMDCAPVCYPSPTIRPREPDQIIENRNVNSTRDR